MMRKTVISVLCILHGVMIVLGVLPGVAALPLALTEGYDHAAQFPLSFCVFIPFFASHLAARRCRSLFSFLLFCLLGTGVLFLFPLNGVLRLLLCLLCVWFTVARISSRTREDAGADENVEHDMFTTPGLLALPLFIALYILGTAAGVPTVRDINYVLAFLYVLLYLLHRNLQNLENYLTVNSTVENIPKKQIARTNAGAMILTVAAAVLFMLIFPLLKIDRLFTGLKDALIALLRAIFKGIKTEPVPETLPDATPDISPGGLIPDSEALPDWALAILSVIRIFFVILAAIFALYLIGYGIYSLIRRFYRPYRDNQDVQEFIRDDKDSKESLLKETLFRRLPFLDPSPGASVRRIYRKTIAKGLSSGKAEAGEKSVPAKRFRGSLSSLSPAELEDAAMLEHDERRALLHETYEKARYSDEPVTREDLKRLKA